MLTTVDKRIIETPNYATSTKNNLPSEGVALSLGGEDLGVSRRGEGRE